MLLKVVERAFKFRVKRSKPPHVYHISNTPQPQAKHSALAGAAAEAGEPAEAGQAGQAGDVVYEDEQCVAYLEAPHAHAPLHLLVVAKRARARAVQAARAHPPDEERLCGHLAAVGAREGRARCPAGFRLVLDVRTAGATLHLHVLG